MDELQRKPDLFRVLRSLIASRKRAGEKAGHFLLLGSASRDLVKQSSESLAGRVRYLELAPFAQLEMHRASLPDFTSEKLWLRGGFPECCLAESDDESWDWRSDFIASYVERDFPPDLSSLGKSLEVDHKTIRSYLDTLTDFYMARQLPPWSGNTKKRLVKSPKAYTRDSGILHRLLNIPDYETLWGHPVLGASWEGYVLESIIVCLSSKWQYSYYRTTGQAEIDLVLEGPKHETWAVEIKRSTAPKVSKGYYLACEDIKATRKLVVYPGPNGFPSANNTEIIGLNEILSELVAQ